jgi:hypothetical protein
MRESELLRRRAETCRSLSVGTDDEELKRKLIALADEYEARAARTSAAECGRVNNEK